MRLPNSYGSVIDLGKRRRKRYAVRITAGYEETQKDGKPMIRQKYKYLAYFEKRTEAFEYLARRNAGDTVPEHVSLIAKPTFAQIFDKWIEAKEHSQNPPSRTTITCYRAAFKKMPTIHDMKISSIRLQELQAVMDDAAKQSRSAITQMLVVMHGVFEYAARYDYIDTDYSARIDAHWKRETRPHGRFTDEEINTLWKSENASPALVMIYTGMRITEFLTARVDRIDFDRRYLIGGIKTDAGKDRVIPLSKKIMPIISDSKNQEYLFELDGKPVNKNVFAGRVWNPLMESLSFDHRTHDCRHTCASLLDAAGVRPNHIKLILGHSLKQDLTTGIYTHVTPEQLVEDIDLI